MVWLLPGDAKGTFPRQGVQAQASSMGAFYTSTKSALPLCCLFCLIPQVTAFQSIPGGSAAAAGTPIRPVDPCGCSPAVSATAIPGSLRTTPGGVGGGLGGAAGSAGQGPGAAGGAGNGGPPGDLLPFSSADLEGLDTPTKDALRASAAAAAAEARAPGSMVRREVPLVMAPARSATERRWVAGMYGGFGAWPLSWCSSIDEHHMATGA